MTADVKKDWNHGQITNSSTSIPKLIAKLHGGESITIQAMIANTDVVYIGKDKSLTSSNGYELDIGATVTLANDISFGVNNILEVYVLPATASDKVSFVKLTDKAPVTEG